MLKIQTIKNLAERRKRVAKLRMEKAKKDIQNVESNNINDCIYLIQHGDTNIYKIGYGNPKKRLKQMQTGNPAYLTLVDTVHLGTHCKNIEKFLHDRYHDYKINGEWFFLTDVIHLVKHDFDGLRKGLMPKSIVPQNTLKEKEHIARWVSTNFGYKSLKLP